ncbi:hypothetical protein [Pseudoalteromonas gelatinilytica]
MEHENIVKVIKDTLNEFFSTKFEETNLSARHYDFTSKDYDFSFPSTIAHGVNEQSLRKKVLSYLTRSKHLVEKNEHYLFDDTGKIYLNSSNG